MFLSGSAPSQRSASVSQSVSQSCSGSATPWLSSSSKTSNSTKVRESDFSPRTRRLAIASKAYVRTSTIYNPEGPFPSTSRLSRMDFAWSTVKETSKNSGDRTIKEAFTRSTNEQTKNQLMKFVSDTLIMEQLLTC
jgi:hypothetical protein